MVHSTQAIVLYHTLLQIASRVFLYPFISIL
nr:MAG TPA: hypothetical protein [Caudoviricetes sp.]